MRADPRTLDRPLVVLDGWRQFEWSSSGIALNLRNLTGATRDDVMALSFPTMGDMDDMADSVITAVERRWPSDDQNWTVEVDVVGHSMGGLVARLAAAPEADARSAVAEAHQRAEPSNRIESRQVAADSDGIRSPKRKRLRIANLYTIATPHRGTIGLARLLAPDEASRDMRPGSERLAELDGALETARYNLVCYAQLNDQTVGARNTAPPGHEPIWTEGTVLFSHFLTRSNKRILADIALRLRGETPLVVQGSEPPRN
jgi:pimeloyl-ACP methyl ester carboxylesterase